MKTVDVVLEELEWSLDDLAAKCGLPIDRVAAIVDGVTGSLVDGRSYLDPVFRHELERYHDAAAKAHREHSGVDTSMPMPMPPPPRAALPPEPNGHGSEPVPAGTSDRQPIAPRPDGDTPATPR